MASLFGASAPAEDPRVVAMREREQRRAEDDRARQTQLGLAQETARRRNLGIGSLLGPLGLGGLTSTVGNG